MVRVTELPWVHKYPPHQKPRQIQQGVTLPSPVSSFNPAPGEAIPAGTTIRTGGIVAIARSRANGTGNAKSKAAKASATISHQRKSKLHGRPFQVPLLTIGLLDYWCLGGRGSVRAAFLANRGSDGAASSQGNRLLICLLPSKLATPNPMGSAPASAHRPVFARRASGRGAP